MSEIIYPKDGRTIRIAPTPTSERMGVAGWEGYAQGTLPEYGYFFFVGRRQLLGEHKIALPAFLEWWYVENDEAL